MKFGLAFAVGLGLASATPSAIAVEKEERSLNKRIGPFGLAVVGGVAAAVVGRAIEIFQNSNKRSEQTWDTLRENLLAKLVAAMDDASEADEATVCARRGEYEVSDWFQVTDRATVAANTDGAEDLFDCFFVIGPSNVTFLQGTAPVDVAVSAGPCNLTDSVLTCA